MRVDLFSECGRHCQLPGSGRRMQQVLQFKLGPHNLLIVAGRFSWDQHNTSVRADRVCTHCGGVALADELHTIYECQAAICCSARLRHYI